MNDEDRSTYLASAEIVLEDATEEMASFFFDVLYGQSFTVSIPGLGELEFEIRKIRRKRV